MFKKCSKFYWSTIRGFDFMKTVYELFDNPSYCAYRKIVVHLKLSLFGSCCFNTKGNILLAALKKIIANQIIQIIFLKIHNNERFCLFSFLGICQCSLGPYRYLSTPKHLQADFVPSEILPDQYDVNLTWPEVHHKKSWKPLIYTVKQENLAGFIL